jgi:anti-sigma-K factor RskA
MTLPGNHDPETPPPVEPDTSDVLASTDAASPVAAVRLLIEERTSANQELALARTAFGIVGSEVRDISMWGSIALACAGVALLALAIGLMIALATVTGEWAAALIVPGILLLVALFAALRVRSGTRRVKAAMDMLKR